MTPLRQRMVDAMVTRGFAARTQESYVEAISRMARHYHRSPALLSKDEVSAYLLDMVSTRHLSYSTMNQAACAARFLYAKVLGFDPAAFHVPMAKSTSTPARAFVTPGDRAPLCLLRPPRLSHAAHHPVRHGPARDGRQPTAHRRHRQRR